MSAHGSDGLGRVSVLGMKAQHLPRDIGAELLAEDNSSPASCLALDEQATLCGHLTVPGEPFADGWLLDSESRGHRGLAPEAFDGTFDGGHAGQYRHYQCLKQLHCLLSAPPVAIPSMHTGKELAAALASAMKEKKVTQLQVAKAFGITQPSVAEWLKYGRIHKKHLTKLVEYFGDKVGPEHWGMPKNWVAESRAGTEGVASPAPVNKNFADPERDTGWHILDDLEQLLPDEREAWINELHIQAERSRAISKRAIDSQMKAVFEKAKKP